MSTQKTTYHLGLSGNSYPELRDAIRNAAQEHGLLEPRAEGALVSGGTADPDKSGKATTGKGAKKPGKPASSTKAEPAEENTAAEDQAASEPASEQETGNVDAEPEITIERLREQLMAYANEHGAAKGKALVESFGVSKISDVPNEKRLEAFKKAGGEL